MLAQVVHCCPPTPDIMASAAAQAAKATLENRDLDDSWQLPDGNVKRGKALFKKHCAQCHSMFPDGRNILGTSQGPTMFNVCGRVSGEETVGRARPNEFGDTLSDKTRQVVWTDAALMNYMRDPSKTSGGPVTMNFEGIKDVQTRVDIVQFLHSLTWDNPIMSETPPSKQPNILTTYWRKMTGSA
mmetsp:Transcript_14384/g.32739  ORF Transcript_14384/g.32739 Transcript_14384/m.32739 type:complete len:185 (+) Transcript_14384:2-556(+)